VGRGENVHRDGQVVDDRCHCLRAAAAMKHEGGASLGVAGLDNGEIKGE
jgi:hypothetical protein